MTRLVLNAICHDQQDSSLFFLRGISSVLVSRTTYYTLVSPISNKRQKSKSCRTLPSHNVGCEPPKQRANKHTDVSGDGKAVGIRRRVFEGGLRGDNGLDEQDKGVDCVAETVEDEEFPLVGCEAYLFFSLESEGRTEEGG
jgi:hypothetical protein